MGCPLKRGKIIVCQLPGGYGFEKLDDAPEQPNSFSAQEYCLFLGNIVFILACENNCKPRALFAVCDN